MCDIRAKDIIRWQNEQHAQIFNNQFSHFSQRMGRNRSEDFASGMKKKDYFGRSCIYNRVCVVGKKETVYQVVEKLQEMQSRMEGLSEQIKDEKPKVTTEEISKMVQSKEVMEQGDTIDRL